MIDSPKHEAKDVYQHPRNRWWLGRKTGKGFYECKVSMSLKCRLFSIQKTSRERLSRKWRAIKDYRVKYPDVSNIGIPVGCSYAAMQILAKAIEMAGTLDREKLRNTIAKVEMMTVRGPIKFRENGSAFIKYGFRQWQDGKNVQIYPKEVAISALRLAPPWDKR
jgi:hypothetical protein